MAKEYYQYPKVLYTNFGTNINNSLNNPDFIVILP